MQQMTSSRIHDADSKNPAKAGLDVMNVTRLRISPAAETARFVEPGSHEPARSCRPAVGFAPSTY